MAVTCLLWTMHFKPLERLSPYLSLLHSREERGGNFCPRQGFLGFYVAWFVLFCLGTSHVWC